MISRWRGSNARTAAPASLQRLGQQGVVGVGEGRAGDLPGLVPVHAVLVDQQAHQLGHGDRRVGVVELDGELLVEARPGRPASLDAGADHVLQRAGDEEVLLLQPQLLARLGLVVGVEHLGDVLGDHLVLDRAVVVADVEGRKSKDSQRLGLPQAQRVARC